MPHGTTVSDEMRRCIDECLSCFRTCLETVTHCLEQGGRHAEAGHIRLLLDRCARDCEAFGDDPVMRACAEACRRCAESCRKMAGGMTFTKAA
jgi:hypothetical protein